jgi:hypothetical protein
LSTAPTKRERPFLGHAIENGKVRFSSVSQIKIFDPKSDGCNRKWAFQYKFGKKPAKTSVLTAGIDHAEKLEHYLKTGEDVLPPVLQAAKDFFPQPGSDLEVEEPLGTDIVQAIRFREAFLKSGQLVNPYLDQINKFAGLTAAGIPIEGAADFRHRRGEYIGPDGDLRRENQDIRVVEIGDLKAVGRIYPHTIMRGKNAGMVLQSYVKTHAEVCEDTQMLGYARHAVNKYPDMTHARLSHIYANKEKREAAKRTGLISVATIIERWSNIENIARKMESVATASRIEDVEPNINACDSFMHVDPADPTGKKMLKGCPHRYYCPLSVSQTAQTMLGTYKESVMSLFDAPVVSSPVVAPPVPPPVFDAAAHAAAVAAEKARLLAEDAPVSLGFCAKCGTSLSTANALKLPSGDVKHIGCAAAVVAPPVPTPAPVAPPLPIAVNPPDQPKMPGLLDAADPVSAEEIAQITDPTLKAKVEQHAREHAERAAAEAAKAEAEKVAAGTSSWCPGSNLKIVVDTTIAMSGYNCSCAKHYTMKQLKPIKEGEQFVSVLPRHKLPKKDAAATTEAVTPAQTMAQLVFETPFPPTQVVPPAPAAPLPASAAVSLPATVTYGSAPGTTAQTAVQAHTDGGEGPGSAFVAPPPPMMEHKTPVAERVPSSQVGVEVYRARMHDGQLLSIIAPSLIAALDLAQIVGHVDSIERLPGLVIA